jgi:hypothetical protein
MRGVEPCDTRLRYDAVPAALTYPFHATPMVSSAGSPQHRPKMPSDGEPSVPPNEPNVPANEPRVPPEDIRDRSLGLLAAVIGTVENLERLPSSLVDNWFRVCDVAKPCLTTQYRKIALRVSELDVRAREVYTEILNNCPDDSSLLAIHRLITSGNVLSQGKKISGRTIDTLVTRYPMFLNASYYLDISDPNAPVIVDAPLFNIGNAYRQKMHQYSKTYFDCFGRGIEVEHMLSSGESIRISLCQFTFFIWATRFGVFQFLDAQYTEIVKMRKQAQKEAYVRKRNPSDPKRNIAHVVPKETTMLCPPVLHDYRRYVDAGTDRRRVYRLVNRNQVQAGVKRKFQPYEVKTLKSYMRPKHSADESRL